MSRIAYVNGRYRPHAAAAVSIDDRAFQFGDGVYEVIEILAGHFVDEEAHLLRLRRSLAELRIDWPMREASLRLVLREVVRRNRVSDGMAYLQISRGAARRDHVFPPAGTRPALVVTARPADPGRSAARAAAGIRVITMPDERWKRPDIKSTSLLPNVLAKEAARLRGAGEAWLLTPDGMIREGASSNAWIIDGANRVITHPTAGSAILAGVTRRTLFELLGDSGVAVDERPFSLDEARDAREAFTTGATTLVMPVVAIDDRPVGDGRPGPIVAGLRERFHRAARHTPVG